MTEYFRTVYISEYKSELRWYCEFRTRTFLLQLRVKATIDVYSVAICLMNLFLGLNYHNKIFKILTSWQNYHLVCLNSLLSASTWQKTFKCMFLCRSNRNLNQSHQIRLSIYKDVQTSWNRLNIRILFAITNEVRTYIYVWIY